MDMMGDRYVLIDTVCCVQDVPSLLALCYRDHAKLFHSPFLKVEVFTRMFLVSQVGRFMLDYSFVLLAELGRPGQEEAWSSSCQAVHLPITGLWSYN